MAQVPSSVEAILVIDSNASTPSLHLELVHDVPMVSDETHQG